MCMCNFACRGCPRNDLYCVGGDVKPYSLTPWAELARIYADLTRWSLGQLAVAHLPHPMANLLGSRMRHSPVSLCMLQEWGPQGLFSTLRTVQGQKTWPWPRTPLPFSHL